MVSRTTKSLVLGWLCLLALQAQAWQDGTHKLIQSLAYKQLTPASVELVEQLLGAPPALYWLNLDQVFYNRRLDPSAQWEASLDYNWMPKTDTEFVPDQHCPARDCLVAGVISSYQALNNPQRSLAERQRALTFFVVLTARLHQPLNAGFASDQGGRLVVVPAAVRDVNLRWIWEEGLYQQAGGDWQLLSSEWPASAGNEFAGVDALAWLAQSRELAVNEVYLPAVDGGEWPRLARRYQSLWETQVSLAARRIAESINAITAQKD